MIYWNTLRYCAGEITNKKGDSILVQTDWDYPGVATTFGWCIANVQESADKRCKHQSTDGTVDCPDCHMTARDFITAAAEYLADNDGAMAEDPGYFGGEE